MSLLCLSVLATGDDQLLVKAMRCLGLLLIPVKTKEVTGDIPFFVRFVPVSILIKNII